MSVSTRQLQQTFVALLPQLTKVPGMFRQRRLIRCGLPPHGSLHGRGLATPLHFYGRALAYFRPDMPLIGLLLVLMSASTLLGLLQAWPLAVLVDSVLSPAAKDDWIHHLFLAALPADRLGQIIGLAGSALMLRLVQEALSLGTTMWGYQLNYNGLLRVRCDVYRKLQELHLSYHRAQPQGDAIYRLTADTFGPQSILGVTITALFAAMTLLVMLGILLTRSVPLTLLALSLVPLVVLANAWFGRVLRHHVTAAKEADTTVTTVVQRSMVSIGLVQAFAREAHEFRHFHGAVQQCIRAWRRLHWREAWHGLTTSTIFAFGGAGIFAMGGYLVYRDGFAQPVPNGTTVGDLMVFLAYLGMLYDPLRKVTSVGATIQGGAAGTQRVFDLLDQPVLVADAPDAISLPVRSRVLALEDVTFAYRPDQPALQNVSLTIAPGELVAVVGHSGAGKSTLLHLFPRFHDPTGGSVRLDGRDLRRIRLTDVRRHIALVAQESLILPTSVAENIAYGRPDATDEQIRCAAEMAGAAAFIERLPHGYQTQMSEGGQTLSAGQRQRIAIARALLTDAPILVLDEPTSALDPEHERLVMDTLTALKGHRTVIVVTHRLSSAASCDRVVVMAGGRVAEQGRHAALMARRGVYSQLVAQQWGHEQSQQPDDADPDRLAPLMRPHRRRPAATPQPMQPMARQAHAPDVPQLPPLPLAPADAAVVLEGSGIPPLALLRFLVALRQTGSVRLSCQHGSGEVVLDNGRIVTAWFGATSVSGFASVEAVEAIGLLPPESRYTFCASGAGTPHDAHDVDRLRSVLHSDLAGLDGIAAVAGTDGARTPPPTASSVSVTPGAGQWRAVAGNASGTAGHAVPATPVPLSS